MLQPLFGASRSAKNLKKDSDEPDPEETYSRQVRIVITNSQDRGDLRGTTIGTTNNMEENENLSNEAQPISRSSGLFSFLSSSKRAVEDEDLGNLDLVALEEGDDGSVETGLEMQKSRYETVEVQNKPKGGLFSMIQAAIFGSIF